MTGIDWSSAAPPLWIASFPVVLLARRKSQPDDVHDVPDAMMLDANSSSS